MRTRLIKQRDIGSWGGNWNVKSWKEGYFKKKEPIIVKYYGEIMARAKNVLIGLVQMNMWQK